MLKFGCARVSRARRDAVVAGALALLAVVGGLTVLAGPEGGSHGAAGTLQAAFVSSSPVATHAATATATPTQVKRAAQALAPTATDTPIPPPPTAKIGRASCRERV